MPEELIFGPDLTDSSYSPSDDIYADLLDAIFSSFGISPELAGGDHKGSAK